jgi:hypothetical protein
VPGSGRASDLAQARVFLALLNSEIDDLAARIEATLLIDRNARANGHLTTTSVACADAVVLRRELHGVHRLVKQLTDRFPTS